MLQKCTNINRNKKSQANQSQANPREVLVNKLIVPAVIVAVGMAAAAAWSQAPAPNPNVKIYFTTPLEKDDGRIVRLQSVTIPAKEGNNFHRHPGDQWAAIQEGEVTFTIKGQSPVVLKAGEGNYVPRGVVHRQQNLSDKPVRYIVMGIFDKGKPVAKPVAE
jgi:quercetin dioxygenase-like cupin family protein